MKTIRLIVIFISIFCVFNSITAQDYYLKGKGPFNEKIPTPKEYLGIVRII